MMTKAKKLKGGIKLKFMLFVVTIVLLIIVVGISLGYYWATKLLVKTVLDNNMEAADQLQTNFSGVLDEEIRNIKIFSDSPLWKEFIQKINTSYGSQQLDDIKKTLLNLNEKWINASTDSDLIKEYLNKPLSVRLKKIIQAKPEIAEIFVTDKYGGLVAASGRTSDFYQADEAWWIAAFDQGKGKLFLGDIDFDESVQSLGVVIAVPIYAEDGSVISVCKAVLALNAFLSPLKKFKAGETGHAFIVDKDGFSIFHPGIKSLEAQILNEEQLQIISSKGQDNLFLKDVVGHGGSGLLITSGVKVTNPYLEEAGIQWFIFVGRDSSEVFAPIKELIVQAALLTLILLIVLAVLAYFSAGKFTAPIEELTEEVFNIGGNNLNQKIKVKTGDEIEQLADAFNEVMADLSKTVISKDYFDHIISNIVDFLIVSDPDRKIEMINKPALDAFGYSKEELVGKGISVLLFEEEMPLHEINFEKLFKNGSISNLEINFRAKDGRIIPVLLSCSVIYDGDGNATRLVATSKDITERKRMEAELQEAYTKLKATQAQLVQAEKMEVVGHMASGIAHEVKNPLCIIMQGINYLEENPSVPQETVREVLQMIKDSLKRADNIIRGILDFSRATELQVAPENVNSILENSLTLVQYKAKLQPIEIVKELKEDLPQVLADRTKLEQVFVNLILNAIDAMSDGGKLYIRSHCSQMDKSDAKVGKRATDLFHDGEKVVTVEIEDTGGGISKEDSLPAV